MGCKNIFIKTKKRDFRKTFLSTSQKKEDIKMDDQIKIKILKSFDNGLQNLFLKTKKRDL
jgi:hypothetical protein